MFFSGLHRQLRPALPPGALLAVPDHAHRRRHQHGQADAAVPRAHVQPAPLHAVRAERPVEGGQRGGHRPRHGHPHRRDLHARPVSRTHTQTQTCARTQMHAHTNTHTQYLLALRVTQVQVLLFFIEFNLRHLIVSKQMLT